MAGGEFRFGTASIYMRRTSADRAARYNSQPRYYMATDLDRVRQFFPDFRRFIVMASRKLGLNGICGSSVPARRGVAWPAAALRPMGTVSSRFYRWRKAGIWQRI